MSGPKVVRIVTREEVLTLCAGQFARLDAAVEEWRRVGQRNDTLSEAEIAATELRRDKLRRLLTQERFLDLQKAVPNEIAFLQADQETRLAQAATAAAQERTIKRRTQSAAASALVALDRTGAPVPPELRRQLEASSAGQGDGVSAISRAFALLSRKDGPAVSEHQRRLADALKESDDRQSFSQWLASQPSTPEDETLARLDRRIAVLAATLGEEATSVFEDRLRHLSSESQSARRSLLLDSLELDLTQAVAAARERWALQGRLRLLAAEIAANSEVPRTLGQSILAGIDGPTESLERLRADAVAVLERTRDEVAARARRQAVLTGLAGLGYQVTEGLETAWVRDGRVVLRKSSQPDYGVELGGGVGSPRMQMRPVAIRNATDQADVPRDRDAETIWCGDLAKLQARCAASGGGIAIEKALPVGATPLKVVSGPSSVADHVQRERPAAPKTRARE